MKTLSDQDLLDVWEAGINLTPIERSLVLLSKAFPNRSFSEIASLTIGERDACLLTIREKLFGSELHNTTTCPECGQKIEWQTTTDHLRLQKSNIIWEKQPIEMTYNGYQVSFRLPNSTDMVEVLEFGNPDSRQARLLEKCVSSPHFPSVEHWPEELKAAVMRKMEECDPQADISMNIRCPDCQHNWDVFFDIIRYIWPEIEDWAIRLIQDIYLLAINFGWSENEILALSRFRRNLYISKIYA